MCIYVRVKDGFVENVLLGPTINSLSGCLSQRHVFRVGSKFHSVLEQQRALTHSHLKDHSLQSEAEGGAKRVGVVGWWGSITRKKKKNPTQMWQKVGRTAGCGVNVRKDHRKKNAALLMLNSKGYNLELPPTYLSRWGHLCVCVCVSPVKNYRFFHRVTKQLLNLIPLTEKSRSSSWRLCSACFCVSLCCYKSSEQIQLRFYAHNLGLKPQCWRLKIQNDGNKKKWHTQILNVTLLQAFIIVMKTQVPDHGDTGARPHYSNKHTQDVRTTGLCGPLWR